MFDLINHPLSFIGNLLEPDPYQNCTSNLVTDNSGLAALAAFQSGQVFGFSVKLLNDLPRLLTRKFILSIGL